MNTIEAMMSFERTPCSKMEDPVTRVRARGAPETNAEIYESPQHLVDCLSRTRGGVLAFEVWKTLARRQNRRSSASISKSLDASTYATPTIREECLSSFDSATSRLVLDRVMSRTDVSLLTSGRRSPESSPPLSPSDEIEDDLVKLFQGKNALRPLITSRKNCQPTSPMSLVNTPVSGARTVKRWLKDRREKKKEEARVNNAQLYAAVSVASTAAAVAAITASTAAAPSSVRRNNEEMMKMDMAVASAATLVAAQCVEAAEAMGANREHLASLISSAVNVRMHDDVTTLTAAAATALRGAATLKARATKGERNIVAVAPAECGIDIGLCGRAATGNSHSSSSGEIAAAHGFLGVCIEDILANGTELLKRTRKGNSHRKIVSVYMNTAGQVILKVKSRHVAGTLMKTDEIVVDVISNSEQCRRFGLKTATGGVFEFECKNRWECQIWTHGVARLLSAAAERKHVHSCWTCSQPKQY